MPGPAAGLWLEEEEPDHRRGCAARRGQVRLVDLLAPLE